MRISDWSSDVCSSDLVESFRGSWRKCRATCIGTGDLTTYQLVGMASRMTTTHTPSQDRPQRGNARAKLIAAAHQTVRRQGYAATSVDEKNGRESWSERV